MERNEYEMELKDRMPRDLQPGMGTWDRNDPRGPSMEPPNRNQEAAALAALLRRTIALKPEGSDNRLLLEAAMMIEALWVQADTFRFKRDRLRWQLNELNKLIDAMEGKARAAASEQ